MRLSGPLVPGPRLDEDPLHSRMCRTNRLLHSNNRPHVFFRGALCTKLNLEIEQYFIRGEMHGQRRAHFGDRRILRCDTAHHPGDRRIGALPDQQPPAFVHEGQGHCAQELPEAAATTNFVAAIGGTLPLLLLVRPGAADASAHAR